MKDDKIICDNCENYEQGPSGVSETCHANKAGSQVIPWLDAAYIENRFHGNAPYCKGFKKVIEWPIWVGPDGATDEELYGPDND